MKLMNKQKLEGNEYDNEISKKETNKFPINIEHYNGTK